MRNFGVPFVAGLTIFIFCFAGTVALRLLLLSILFVIAVRHYLKERPPLPSVFWLFLASCVFAAASIMWSVDPEMSLGEVKNEFVYTFLAFFSFYVLAKRNDVLVAGITAMGLAALTMVGLAAGAQAAAGRWVYVGYQGGVGNYSTFVVAAIPVLAYLTWAERKNLGRIFFALVLAGLLLTGFWTLNRALWPALVVEVLLGAVLLLGQLGRWRAGLVALLGVSLVFLPFFAAFETRFGASTDIQSLVMSDPRGPMWAAAGAAIAEHPLVGVGFGREVFGKAYKGRPGVTYGHAHNLLLNRTIQLGVIGLLLAVLLFGTLARALWRVFRYCPDQSIAFFAAAVLVYLAGLLSKNMTDDFFIREVSLLFWSIMGLALGAARRFSDPSKNQLP